MPKKGLIAIPGMISASGSEGFGLMQMPPVSGNAEIRLKRSHITRSLISSHSTDFPESVSGAIKGHKYYKISPEAVIL